MVNVIAIRSARSESTSRANTEAACSMGCPASSLASSPWTWSRTSGGATGTVAVTAWCNPDAPVIMSRSCSAQEANASARSASARLAVSGPSRAGVHHPAAAASTAPTGHPVTSPTTAPAPAAPATRSQVPRWSTAFAQ